MEMQTRIEAARAYVEALRTGDRDAAQAAAPHLAEDIVVQVGKRKFEGNKEALRRITGTWPSTGIYRKGSWGDPWVDGSDLKVSGQMGPVGNGLAQVNLTFGFSESDQINRVEQENLNAQVLFEGDTLPDFVRARVNHALANETPLCVSYVDEEGRPHLSLRGSTQVFSDTQISIWVRTTGGGLADAVAKNPSMCLLYRENPTRSTFTFAGKAHVDSTDEVRRKVFENAPEVEQNHETWTSGVALIIDLEQVDGASPEGRVRMRRS